MAEKPPEPSRPIDYDPHQPSLACDGKRIFPGELLELSMELLSVKRIDPVIATEYVTNAGPWRHLLSHQIKERAHLRVDESLRMLSPK